MSAFELGVASFGQALVLFILAGLVVRRNPALCYAFGFYLLFVLVTDLAMLASPALYTRSFWLSKEILTDALKCAVALELGARIFGAFPGARAMARVLLFPLLLLLISGTIYSLLGVLGSAEVQRKLAIVGDARPKIVTGTTWLFAAIAALVLWFRLPVDPLQKAILIGFVPYLIFLKLSLQLRLANDWPPDGWLASIDTSAYLAVLVYWARAAWRPLRQER